MDQHNATRTPAFLFPFDDPLFTDSDIKYRSKAGHSRQRTSDRNAGSNQCPLSCAEKKMRKRISTDSRPPQHRFQRMNFLIFIPSKSIRQIAMSTELWNATCCLVLIFYNDSFVISSQISDTLTVYEF